jgi:hypothetical protein
MLQNLNLQCLYVDARRAVSIIAPAMPPFASVASSGQSSDPKQCFACLKLARFHGSGRGGSGVRFPRRYSS